MDIVVGGRTDQDELLLLLGLEEQVVRGVAWSTHTLSSADGPLGFYRAILNPSHEGSDAISPFARSLLDLQIER